MKLLLSIVCLLITAIANSQSSGLYGEASYGLNSIKDSSSENLGTWKPKVTRYTLGGLVSNNVAVEVYWIQGLAKSATTSNIEIKQNDSYGFAIRPFYNLTEKIEIFGRVGPYSNKFTATDSGTPKIYTFKHVSYSVGSAYKFNNRVSAIFDYTKLNNKDALDAYILTAGLRYNF